jgi:outer membrane receptor protein involved in Fe transport
MYVSGETDFGDIRTSLGLRYDNFWINTEETPGYVDDDENLLPTDDEHYSNVNASLGLVYGLGANVNLVTNVGTAYRIPNVVERFFFGSASGRQTRPNVDIKPEHSVTVDFGVKAVHGEINYSLIGFYSDYSDFTQLVNYDSLASGDPLWRYENIDDISILGFEGLVEAELNNGIYGSVSFTYQRGENKTIDQPLFVSPIKSSLTVGYRHQPSSVFGDLTIRVVGSQDRVPDVTYLDDVATNGFTVVSATTGVRLFGNVRLSITGYNLLDEIYSEPFNSRNPDNPVPEPGRNFVFSVSSSL